MRRLTLAGQIALIITVAVFLAQAINLAIAIDNRRSVLLGDAVVPAANRLVNVVANPQAVAAAPASTPAAPTAHGHKAPPREQPKVTSAFPAKANAQREKQAEAMLANVFQQQSVAVPEVRAVTVMADGNREPVVLLAARLADGRWASVRAGPQQPLLPLVGTLGLQALLIAILVLLPSLLLLRRVGGSLTRLADSAAAFDPRRPAEPVEPSGPSDVRRLVEAVNAMQERIVGLDRERDVMLGAIGHDLRTPLTALRLEAEAVADPGQRSALVGQIEQLHDDFEQILAFARAGLPTTEPAPVDLAALVTAIAAEPGGRGIVVDRLEPCAVEGDSRSLRRAILNLVDNARRYGGGIAEVSVARDAQAVVLAVADHGPGIAPDDRARALQPFVRAEPSRNRSTGGHGLGLAIVAAIARAHGGALELGERKGGGLRATLRLPGLPSPAGALH